MTIDRLDARLIATLRTFPRVGLLEVARQLGVARGTVQARLAKLEARGVITGHGPEVDPSAMGYPISAFILVELAQGELAAAVAIMESIPELLEADAISGPQDLICRVVAQDTEHLQDIVNQITATPRDPPVHELHRADAPGSAAHDAADRGGGATFARSLRLVPS